MAEQSPRTGSDAGQSRRVFIVDGCRTPFLKARGKPGPFTSVDLAVLAGRPLLLKYPGLREAIGEVILGCGAPPAEATNPSRVAALRMGLGKAMPGFTVQRNCGSGMQSIDTGYRYIAKGDYDVILAGGTEALSHAPLLFSRAFTEWFADFYMAKNLGKRLAALAKFRPGMLKPVIGLEKGLSDPVVKLNMGQTAEVLAHEWGISREEADSYAVESHKRLARAQEEGWLDDEVEPIYDSDGNLHDHDDGVRPDSSVEKLAKLKPAFEKPFGKVTPGNSSQITDGACWVLLASERAVDEHKLEPLGEIIDSDWAALDAARMGLGPTYAASPIIKRNGLGLGDLDAWEINEAFAAQVLSCLKAWQDAEFCKDQLGLDGAFGAIPREKLNVDGGAVSLGHPVGTSGTRIVLRLLHVLKRLGGTQGIASECIGGGQGGAMLLRTV